MNGFNNKNCCFIFMISLQRGFQDIVRPLGPYACNSLCHCSIFQNSDLLCKVNVPRLILVDIKHTNRTLISYIAFCPVVVVQ